MVSRFSPIALILFLSAHPALADTFTWAGNTGNFSDPASWSGPAPTPPGSPTDQLVFPAPVYPQYIATIDSPQPWTLNSLVVPGNAYDGPILLAAPSSGLYFDGTNPTISSTASSNLVLNTPITTTSSLTFSDIQATLSGSLSSSDPNSSLNIQNAALTLQNNTPPSGFAQTVIGTQADSATLTWKLALDDTAPAPLALGTGPILINSGTFHIDAQPPANVSSFSLTLTNPITIAQSTGRLAGTSPSPVASATFNFSGPITLGGSLVFDGAVFAPTSVQSTTLIASGTISLDQRDGAEPLLGAISGLDLQQDLITGNIVNDPNPAHTTRNPLTFQVQNYLWSGNNFIIAGTRNTYSTGTVISFGIVTVAPGSSLGTGPITVNSGVLRLSSTDNLNPGQKVHLAYDGYSALAITFDKSPYALLDSTSGGILLLDTTFTTPLDESLLGNGKMALGSAQGAIYAAPSLRPGSDRVYRFDTAISSGTASVLTLLHPVLTDYDGIPSKAEFANVILAASNSYSGGTTINGDVTVTASGALGTGDISVGLYSYGSPFPTLFLSAPDAYSPSAKVTVNGTLAAVGQSGSIPLSNTPPILQPGSTLTLGDTLFNNSDRYPDSMPIHLNSSSLILKGTGITTETVGPLSISGLSTIILQNPSTGSHTTTLIAPSLSRDDHTVLFLIPYQEPANYTDSHFLAFTPTGTNNANLRLLAPPVVTNGMVSPWIQTRQQTYQTFYFSDAKQSPPSFLTYTPDGFATASYVPMPTAGGTGSEIVDVSSPDNSPVPLNNNTTIYALRTSASLSSPATITPTLHIASGGLIAFIPASSGNIPLTVAPNVDFTSAEAFVNVQSPDTNNDTHVLQIDGIVTVTAGLTKFGSSTLRLTNPNNHISGPITILEGTLDLSALPEPTSPAPIHMTSGSNLLFQHTTTLTRPVAITLGDKGYYPCNIGVPADQSLTLAASITGETMLQIIGGASLRVITPITYAGALSLFSQEIRLDAPISASTVTLGVGTAGHVTGTSVIASQYGVLFDRGTISPGDSTHPLATITFDNPETDLSDGATLAFDLGSDGNSDHLVVVGTLSLAAPFPGSSDLPTTLALNFLSPTGDTYTLLSAASLTGTFGTVSGLPDGYSLEYTATSLLLVPTASIPEPCSALFLLASLPAVLLIRKRSASREDSSHEM